MKVVAQMVQFLDSRIGDVLDEQDEPTGEEDPELTLAT
jgi:hypothetical protein